MLVERATAHQIPGLLSPIKVEKDFTTKQLTELAQRISAIVIPNENVILQSQGQDRTNIAGALLEKHSEITNQQVKLGEVLYLRRSEAAVANQEAALRPAEAEYDQPRLEKEKEIATKLAQGKMAELTGDDQIIAIALQQQAAADPDFAAKQQALTTGPIKDCLDQLDRLYKALVPPVNKRKCTLL